MKDLMVGILSFLAVVAVLYGIYWVGKTVSYELFYADMVEQTIRDMVKPEYLINGGK